MTPTSSRTQAARLRLSLAAASLLAAMPSAGCAARGYGGLSNVFPLAAREGTTTVQHFAPDGRQALVIAARMPGATNPSLMALLPREGGWAGNGTTTDGWDVVAMPDPAGRGMAATFDPHNGAALFARAKVRGMPATVLLAALPDAGDAQPLGQPRRMTVLAYQLETGARSASFSLIDRTTTAKRYCHAADALSAQFGIAMPGDAGLCRPVS